VRSGAHASRILIERGRAVGVEFVAADSLQQANAAGEVILCGGAVNSPQILLLSGIGPAEQLRALNIPVVADLPGVGENLQDHPAMDMRWRITPRVSLARAESPWSLLQYLLFRRGPLTSNVAEAGGFHRTRDGLAAADIQLHFVPLTLARHVDTKPSEHGFSCAITLVGTHSRGRIRLRSSQFKDAPLIDPDYLSDPREWAALRAGARLMRRIAAARAFAPFAPVETQPGPAAQSDGALDSFIREKLETLYHPVGTCKMGPASDPLAVVDPELRVRGIAGLRVANASIMPLLPNGNTNAPAIMIAEKAADLIRAR
jgi:choline dehydrogenase